MGWVVAAGHQIMFLFNVIFYCYILRTFDKLIYIYMKHTYISICMGISKLKIFIFEIIRYIHFCRETYHMSLEYAIKKRVPESIQQYERKLNTHILSLNNKI